MTLAERPAIGVDLGTTFSAAAAFRAGKVEPITLGTSGWSIPSVVHLSESGGIVAGESAVVLGGSAPSRTFQEFKRDFGSTTPYQTPDGPRTPQWMTTQLLSYVLEKANEIVTPEVLTITHPANWGPHRLEMLRRCVVDVGTDVAVEFLAEPIAAATQYAALGRLQTGETVAIYDFGGGTFDASVVHNDGMRVEIVGATGGCDVGGIDLDHHILDFIDDMTDGLVSQADTTNPSVAADLYTLRNDCADYKVTLSNDLRCPMRVRVGDDAARDVQLQRHEFERLISDDVNETITVLLDTIKRSGTSLNDLSRVLLVGGSSRIPLVGRAVSEATNLPISVDIDTASAIAQGAATHGSGGGLKVHIDTGPVRTPEPVAEANYLGPGESLGEGASPATPSLSVRWLNTEAHSVGEETILVGRGSTCDLVVSDDLVSRLHGRFEHRSGSWYYVDDSRNGSLINARPINEALISDETEIQLGEGGPTIVANAQVAAKQMFKVSTSDQLMYPTEGRTYLIGRRPPADLVVDDPQQYVSSKHLELTHDGERWVIRDVSTNGTFYSDGRRMDSTAHEITGYIALSLGIRTGPIVEFDTGDS